MIPATQLQTLTEVCNLPTAPYCEQHVIAYLLQWAAAKNRVEFISPRRDLAGNVYLVYKHGKNDSAEHTPLVVEAHMDHPGFISTGITNGGEITAFFRGGVKPSHFKDAAVGFWINDPPAVGNCKPVRANGHWATATVREVKGEGPHKAMTVALTAASAEIPAGSIGMWALPEARVENELFSARVCDDLAGVAAALCMLEELIAQRMEGHVIALFTRAEEVGFAGVLAVAQNGWIPRDSRVIGLETSKGSAFAPQGEGPIVRVGDKTGIFSAGLTHFICQAAAGIGDEDSKFKFQRKLMDGGTCNSTAFLAFGYDAAGMCVSLGNYHNMAIEGDVGYGQGAKAGPGIAGETIHLGDFSGMVRILVQCAKRMSLYQPGFGAVRSRLEKLHADEQKNLLYGTSDYDDGIAGRKFSRGSQSRVLGRFATQPFSSDNAAMSDESLIQTPSALAELCEHLHTAGLFAFDTEFIGEFSYEPRLCLIQVATASRVELIDPLAISDLSIFWEVLADPTVSKVVHAGEQDLMIAWQHGGRAPMNVYDTQIGGGMMGLGYPLAYWRLAELYCGITLDKAHTYSAWDRRPLTPAQVKYAQDDVRYLLQIQKEMHGRITQLQRNGWMSAACAEECRRSAVRPDPRAAYLKIKGTAGLSPLQLSVLRELAAWREQLAFENNLPARTTLKDEWILELATRMPKTPADLARIAAIPRQENISHGQQIADAIARGRAVPEEERPIPIVPGNDSMEVKRLADTLFAAAQVICLGQSLTPGLVTSQAEMTALARQINKNEDLATHPLMTGWHRMAIGQPLREFIEGKTELRVRMARRQEMETSAIPAAPANQALPGKPPQN